MSEVHDDRTRQYIEECESKIARLEKETARQRAEITELNESWFQCREQNKRAKEELAAARAELERAMKVIEAAKSYADFDDQDCARNLKHRFWEWEAGR